MWTRLVAVTCLAAGCAAPLPPSAPAPVAQALATPVRIGPVDGVYRGTAIQLKVAGRHVCTAPSGEVRLSIRDGVLTRQWNGAQLQATVQPDGSFRADGGGGQLAGQVGGGTLEFNLGGEYCSLHFSMRRAASAE